MTAPARRLAGWLAIATLLGASAYLVSTLIRAAAETAAVRAYDIYSFAYPVALYARDAVRHGGRGLFWNPLQNCGQPFLGSGVTGALYPPFLFFLVLGGDHALYALLVFNLAVGSVGAYLLCRELGVGTIAALCGGLAFGFSNAGADVITYTPLVSGPYAWMPAAILCCERILKAPTLRRGIALGVVLTLALLPGHPQPLLYIYQLIALYVAFAVAVRSRWLGVRTLWTLLLGLAMPPLLGAVHLLPALEVMRASVRNASLSWTEMSPGSYLTWQTFQTSFTYRRDLFNPVDLVPLMLASAAVCATQLWRFAIFFGLVALVSLDLAMGANGYLFPLYTGLPLGRLFRDPERYLWVTAFCVAVLAAIGVDAICSWETRSSQWPRRLGGIVLPALVLLGLSQWVPNVGRYKPERFVLAVVLGACVLGAFVPRLRPAAGLGLALAMFLSLLVFRLAPFRHLLPSDAALYSNADVFHLVRDQLTPQERIYVVGKHADFSLQQKTGSLFGVPSLFDYESLPTRRFAEFYTMLRTGQHMHSLVDFYYPVSGPLPQTTRHRLLDLAATRYLLVDSSEDTTGALRDPPLVPITEVENVRVYENTTALPRARWVPLVNVEPDAPRLLWRLAWGRDDLARAAFVETSPPSGFTGAPGDGRQGSVIFVQNDPERVVLRVDAPQRGFLVLADQWFPGWQATVGGTPVPILRADYVFRLVEVPAGRSTVEFRYVPDALLLGALISAVTAGAIVLALVRLPRRKQLKDGAEDGYTGSPRVPSRSTRWQHGGS